MKRALSNVVTGVLVVCALLVSVAVARREFAASPATTGPRPVAEWQELTTAGLRLGHQDAPVVLLEFADFQCPFCAVEARNIRDVLSHNGNDVAVVYRHFALEHLHPYAYEAAVAAECAAAQDRFDAFHDVVFDRQDEIGVTPWSQFAAKVGAWRDRLVGIEYSQQPFDPVLKSYQLRGPVPT